MKKIKTKCHICSDVTKTPPDQQPPAFCGACGTNLRDPNAETMELFTVVEKEAGGVSAELVNVYLTSRRLMFEPNGDDGGTAGAVGWAVGGLVGGLVAGAIAGAVAGDQKTPIISVARDDIVSLSEVPTGMLKNKVRLTAHIASGMGYGVTLSKKECEKWKSALNKPVTSY